MYPSGYWSTTEMRTVAVMEDGVVMSVTSSSKSVYGLYFHHKSKNGYYKDNHSIFFTYYNFNTMLVYYEQFTMYLQADLSRK